MIALPGEKLGVIEAFEPIGEYKIVDGNIIATKLSKVMIDKKLKIIKIEPIKPGVAKEGDVLLGRVEYIQRPFAFVTLYSSLNPGLATDLKGLLYVNPELELPPVLEGSLIRTKVAKISAGTIMLSIDGQNLGAVEAYCNFCGGPLVKRDKNTAKCLWCGRILKIKLAPDFKGKALEPRLVLE